MIARWHQCGTMTSQMVSRASFSAVCLTVFPFEFRPRTFTIGFYGKNSIISELMILECSFPLISQASTGLHCLDLRDTSCTKHVGRNFCCTHRKVQGVPRILQFFKFVESIFREGRDLSGRVVIDYVVGNFLDSCLSDLLAFIASSCNPRNWANVLLHWTRNNVTRLLPTRRAYPYHSL